MGTRKPHRFSLLTGAPEQLSLGVARAGRRDLTRV